MSTIALQGELETYEQKLPTLLDEGRTGKFVLIHDKMIVEFFGTYEDAINAGYDKFGTQPFLVKKVEPFKKILYFRRSLFRAACRT
jgi:hypothetical protein